MKFDITKDWEGYPERYEYYSDLYDSFTIAECKRTEVGFLEKDIPEYKGRKITPEEWSRIRKPFTDLALYFLKGERYKKKSETINKWLEEDRKKEEKLEGAIEPQRIRCLGCSSLDMECLSRDFMTAKSGKEEVLFMFECRACGKRRAYWESGKEWEYDPKCPKCHSSLVVEHIKADHSVTTRSSCPQCEYKEEDTIDFNEKKEESKIDPDFASDQKKYCLSDEEGRKYIEDTQTMKDLSESIKDKEENKDVFEAIKNIQMLTILELQNLLTPILEKTGYVQLSFEKPEIQKDVILGFSFQDSKSGRVDRESTYDAHKVIKKALEATNWRLMSDGLSYKLGFLQGRLRGVEGEEALRKLAESKLRK
ncbi:MAG: hypothetical protein WAV46_04135 [Candidatus Moraniibacteriota bacterium]